MYQEFYPNSVRISSVNNFLNLLYMSNGVWTQLMSTCTYACSVNVPHGEVCNAAGMVFERRVVIEAFGPKSL